MIFAFRQAAKLLFITIMKHILLSLFYHKNVLVSTMIYLKQKMTNYRQYDMMEAINPAYQQIPDNYPKTSLGDLAQFNDYKIGIGNGNPEDISLWEDALDLIIPVLVDEFIVSINFADQTTQEMWEKSLATQVMNN